MPTNPIPVFTPASSAPSAAPRSVFTPATPAASAAASVFVRGDLSAPAIAVLDPAGDDNTIILTRIRNISGFGEVARMQASTRDYGSVNVSGEYQVEYDSRGRITVASELYPNLSNDKWTRVGQTYITPDDNKALIFYITADNTWNFSYDGVLYYKRSGPFGTSVDLQPINGSSEDPNLFIYFIESSAAMVVAACNSGPFANYVSAATAGAGSGRVGQVGSTNFVAQAGRIPVFTPASSPPSAAPRSVFTPATPTASAAASVFVPDSSPPSAAASVFAVPSITPALPGVILPLPVVATAATGTITVTGVITEGDSFTVAGITFTFKNSPSGSFELATDSPSFVTSEALKIRSKINQTSLISSRVTATVSGAVVTITAQAKGTSGNSITLAKSGPMTVSGSTLTGGTGGVVAPIAVLVESGVF